MSNINWKKASRMDWETAVVSGDFPGFEQLKIGAILRIADSLESIDRSLRQVTLQRMYQNTDFENLRKRVSKISKSLKGKK